MQEGIAFIHLQDLWAHCAQAADCGGVAPGILCGGREKGVRSLWIPRVRCLPCAIILANALTERVWSAAPGLREKRSWAASLFTLARARRSLPSSDLNGHCLSRGAVSLRDKRSKEGMPGQTSGCQTRWYRGIQPSLGKREAPKDGFLLPSAGGTGHGPRADRKGR